MSTIDGLIDIDANGRAVTSEHPFKEFKAVTFTANGTVAKILFHVTGVVEIGALYGIVTTAIGSNHTAAHWRINDQTITSQVISLATGTTISSLPAGTILTRKSLLSVALIASTAATGLVVDPVAATVPSFFMPFLVVQKTASVQTNIEYVYTTNNTSLGAMTFYVKYRPLSDNGKITPA